MIPMLDLTAQLAEMREAIDAGLRDVLDSGRFVLGPNVTAFEEEVARYLGASHAVGCASGTDALHLALAGLGIGPGDEVITTPFTFAATAEAISYLGARPVFADIDPRTFNIDPDCMEAAVGPATRAVLPVHLFGQPAAMEAVEAVADRHGLYVVEDCAQSFGATRGGRQTGTMGVAGCFSFFPSKNLGGCGDGGLITTGSDALAATLRQLRNHGSREYAYHEMLGYNSRLDEIQAVILREKLKRIDAYNASRRRVAQRYTQALAELPDVVTPFEGAGGVHVYHQYTVLLPDRDAVAQALREAGVGCAVYYPRPLHRQPVFAAAAASAELPVAEDVASRCLSLPIFPELTDTQIDAVIRAVRAAVLG